MPYDQSDDYTSSSSDYDDCDGSEREPLCEGVNRFGYDYCCSQHDPSLQRRTFAPHMFTISGLRYDKEDEIVQVFGEEDFYRTNSLLPDDPQLKQLDHIVELQCFAYAFNEVCENRRRCGKSIKSLMALKGHVREEIANDNDNLCMTRTTTNQLKGAAVWKFLDDQITGHRCTACLYSYLARQEMADTGKVLRRSEMRNITRKMGWALRRCQRNISQQGQHLSNAAIAEVNHQLDHLYDDMVLG